MPLGGKGPTTIAVLSAEAVLSAAFVAMRFYTRKVIKGGVGSDDYLLIMTWFFQALFVALMIASSIYGFGQHTKDISLDDIRVATKIELIGQLVVSLAMGLSKTSVAMFLMRIIITVWHRVVLWFWIVTMMTWYCKAWSAAMDFFLAAFPWAILWNLNMQRREKVTICVSLSLGIFAGVCGIIRTSGLAVLSQTADYLYATADSVMWTSSELTITIVCVSAPVLRPLWRKLVGRTSTDQSYGNSDRSNEIMTIGRIRKARKTDTELALDTIPRPDIKNTRTTAIGTNRGNLNTGSQQSILRNSQAIQKTKEFTISYEE